MLLHSEEFEALVASGSEAERSGEWTNALTQYSAALLQASEAGEFPRVCELLRAIGRLHFERGDYDRAAEAFELSLERANGISDQTHIAAALNCRAVVEQFRGNVEGAQTFYLSAAQIAEEIADPRLSALVEQNLATLATVRGDYEAALAHNHNALKMFRTLGQQLATARVQNNIGMLYADMGEYGHAELSLRGAHTLAERFHDAGLAVKVQINRADLALRKQDYDAALQFCDGAFREYTRLGSESGLSETYKLYGMWYRETGNSPLANTHLQLALRLAQACGDRLLEAESQREYALLHMQEGHNRDALTALNHAHRIFQELHARREVADIERKLERVEKIYLRVVAMLETDLKLSLDAAAVEQYQRVAQYATQLAGEVGFQGRDLNWLRIGAFLYDIGKRSVPEKVLNKPGELTIDEWEIVKQHVTDSEQVIAELDPPWDMRPMVRHHHEHWDGTGYPDGLQGEEIPLAARVLSIADAFTALTSHRSYRKKLDAGQALEVMEAEAGIKFDPRLFRSFRALIEN